MSFSMLLYLASCYAMYRLGRFTEHRPYALKRYARLVWAWVNK
jgi:hypothetical protein